MPEFNTERYTDYDDYSANANAWESASRTQKGIRSLFLCQTHRETNGDANPMLLRAWQVVDS